MVCSFFDFLLAIKKNFRGTYVWNKTISATSTQRKYEDPSAFLQLDEAKK
jgi:hypothetical protein